MIAVAEERDEYVVIAAKRASFCPHCPESIVPGDAIVLREVDDGEYSHRSCALEQDEIDADPEGYAAAMLHEHELRKQAEIAASIVRGPVHDHGRQRPRKRKARRSAA